jgi:hypothetical protein
MSFLNVIDEILITTILPRFTLKSLNTIVLVNKRLNILCLSEEFWKYKAMQDFPIECSVKFQNKTWFSYYHNLETKKIPLYYNLKPTNIPFLMSCSEKIIDNVILYKHDLETTIKSLSNYTKYKYGDSAIFIDRNSNPAIVVKFPSLETKIISNEINNLTKAIIIPPIYGNVTNGVFRIEERHNQLSPVSDRLTGEQVLGLPKHKLLQILRELGITINLNIQMLSKTDLCYKIRAFLEVIGHVESDP